MAVDLAVVGLGYVGLPLSLAASDAGLSVLGLDIDKSVVDGLTAGVSHVDDVHDSDVERMLSAGFRATTDESELELAEAIAVCVPTPLTEDGGPDLTAVRSAMLAIARYLRAGMLVILESTTYPGTTDEVVRPLLEQTGLLAGRDFSLAFSPERIDPGNPSFGLRNTPRIVGGQTPACTERAAAFYGRFIDTVVRARGTREAETAKLLENTYRHVNIALVNEMARFCHELDIDLWDVIRCAATKPFGYHAFHPGPGVGGHCIPIDPNYLSHNVRARLGYPFRFVELAQEINASMPVYVVQRVQDMLNAERLPLNGATVLLLGITYKPDIADQRESPAGPLAKHLAAKGAVISYHDPYIETWRINGAELASVDDLDAALAAADVAILLQDHTGYLDTDLASRARRLLDTRGALAPGPAVERL
jgi:UDP-N-acetyl-D-glucosamine dehydrogenase